MLRRIVSRWRCAAARLGRCMAAHRRRTTTRIRRRAATRRRHTTARFWRRAATQRRHTATRNGRAPRARRNRASRRRLGRWRPTRCGAWARRGARGGRNETRNGGWRPSRRGIFWRRRTPSVNAGRVVVPLRDRCRRIVDMRGILVPIARRSGWRRSHFNHRARERRRSAQHTDVAHRRDGLYLGDGLLTVEECVPGGPLHPFPYLSRRSKLSRFFQGDGELPRGLITHRNIACEPAHDGVVDGARNRRYDRARRWNVLVHDHTEHFLRLFGVESRRPVSASQSTIAAAKTSVRRSTRPPRSCSGAMYASLPLSCPSRVVWMRAARLGDAEVERRAGRRRCRRGRSAARRRGARCRAARRARLRPRARRGGRGARPTMTSRPRRAGSRFPSFATHGASRESDSPCDVLHDEEELARRRHDVERRDDVRVPDARGEPRLVEEHRDELGILARTAGGAA